MIQACHRPIPVIDLDHSDWCEIVTHQFCSTFSPCHRRQAYTFFAIHCPQRPERCCRHLRRSACRSIRLFVRLYELACRVILPEFLFLLSFTFCRNTLQVKSSGKFDHLCPSSSNMRKKWLAIYGIPEVIFYIKHAKLDIGGLLVTYMKTTLLGSFYTLYLLSSCITIVFLTVNIAPV